RLRVPLHRLPGWPVRAHARVAGFPRDQRHPDPVRGLPGSARSWRRPGRDAGRCPAREPPFAGHPGCHRGVGRHTPRPAAPAGIAARRHRPVQRLLAWASRYRLDKYLTMKRHPSLLPALDRLLPPPLVSAHFVLGLEVARLLKWLVPPPEIEGRRFAIKVDDVGLRSCFTCRNGRFRPLWTTEADLELGASFGDFLALVRGTSDADTLFFQRRLR